MFAASFGSQGRPWLTFCRGRLRDRTPGEQRIVRGAKDAKDADPSSAAGESPAKATSPSGGACLARIRSQKGIRKACRVFASACRRYHTAVPLGESVRSLSIMNTEPAPRAITSAIMPATPSMGVECIFDTRTPAAVEWAVVR